MHHDAQGFAAGVEDVQAAGAAAIDIAFGVHFHPVGHALPRPAQVGEHPLRGQGQGAVILHIKGADDAPAGVVDVEDAFVRRKGQAVGDDKVGYQQGQRAQVGGEAKDAGDGLFPLLAGAAEGPGVGEVDAAVGFDDHIVGAVELAALELVGEDGGGAVVFPPADAAAVVFGGDEAALQVAGEAVVPVDGFGVHGDAAAGGVAHPAVVVDVAEQQIAAVAVAGVSPPQRPFGRPLGAAEAGAVFGDGRIAVNDGIHRVVDSFNGHSCASCIQMAWRWPDRWPDAGRAGRTAYPPRNGCGCAGTGGYPAL